MTKNKNSKLYDLEDRTFLFAKKVRAFVKELPKTLANIEDGKQVIKSSGSVGANYTCPVKQLEIKMYYTYVLQSLKDLNFYTGFTKDLKLRFEQHNKGLVESTKNRKPFELIYYEACINEADAVKREKYLKTYNGKMFLRRRLKSYLTG